MSLATKAKDIPLRVIYGTRDALIDRAYLRKVVDVFTTSDTIVLDGQGHNFALSSPANTLEYIFPGRKFTAKPGRAPIIPRTFARQLVQLAAPILTLKGIFYISVGLLLFSTFAPVVITLGVGGYFFYLGHAYIRGAFSLKNEHYSYFWYLMLGLAIILFGIFVIQHPQYALQISTLVACGMVLLAGLARLIVGVFWTSKRSIRNGLLLTGSAMFAAGALALTGGLISIHLIVYTAAVLLIARGILFIGYVGMAIGFAYVRGFNR